MTKKNHSSKEKQKSDLEKRRKKIKKIKINN